MGRTPAVDWYDFRGLAFLLGNRVLARFWGRERRGFFGGVASFGVPVFFRSSLSPSPCPPPSFLVAGLGVSSPPVRWLATGHRTTGTCSGRA